MTISDESLRRLAKSRVNEDPAALQAWQNQHQAPEAWRKIENRISTEILGEFGRRDLTATSDIEAMEAFVRGGNTQIETRKRFDASGVGNMSPAQYLEWKREQLGS